MNEQNDLYKTLVERVKFLEEQSTEDEIIFNKESKDDFLCLLDSLEDYKLEYKNPHLTLSNNGNIVFATNSEDKFINKTSRFVIEFLGNNTYLYTIIMSGKMSGKTSLDNIKLAF